MDFEDNIIQLVDEDDKEFNFEHILTFDYEDKQYIVLMPIDDDEIDSEDDTDELAELDGAEDADFDDYDDEEDDGEIVILEVVQDEDGNDTYLSIEDDDLLDELYNVYIQTVESLE